MIAVLPPERQFRTERDWLSARHHFSIGEHYDPTRLGFGPLRVWNDDLFRANSGFPMHPHQDMEIITYVRKGAISHEDHLGNRGRTKAGDVQVMSAGTGIMHAEFNLEAGDTELFQIWIRPNRRGVAPRWEQRRFPKDDRSGRLVPLVSGRLSGDGVLFIQQDATLFGATLAKGGSIRHPVEPGRGAYLVPSQGEVVVNGTTVPERSGVEISDETEIIIEARTTAEILLLDLPL